MAIEIDLSDSEKIQLFQTELNKAAEEKKISGSVSSLVEENFSTITKLIENQGSDSGYKTLVKLFKKSFKVTVKESTLRSYYSKAKKKLENKSKNTGSISENSQTENHSGRVREDLPPLLPPEEIPPQNPSVLPKPNHRGLKPQY
jgi:DNA replication initiation complex subunit (GINS family)